MKKITLLFAFIAFALSVQAQQVDNNQWTLLMKRTASWCPYCGGDAWDFYKDAQKEFENSNLVVIAAHSSGDLNNPTSREVANIVAYGGQPQFIINNSRFGGTSINKAQKLKDLKDVVDYSSSQEAVLGVGTLATLDKSGSVSVRNTVEFLKDGPSADFFLGNYLIKKTVVGEQSGRGSNANHTNVLIDELSGNPLGRKLSFSANTTGGSATLMSEKKLDISDLDDYFIYSIVWIIKDGNNEFYNATRVPISIETNVPNGKTSNLKVVSQTPTTLTLQLDADYQSVEVYDSAGQMVRSIAVSSDMLSIDTAHLAAGVYYLNSVGKNTSRSMSFVVSR